MIFTGSFKTRGVTLQMARLNDETRAKGLVTMSAGNYGKAFAYFCNKLNINGTVVMPITAPKNRETLIKVINKFCFLVLTNFF